MPTRLVRKISIILALLSLTFGSAATLSGCSDDGSSQQDDANILPEGIVPSVNIEKLAISPQQGPSPLEIAATIQVVSGDPRATITLFIDYGDGSSEDIDLTTGLSGEFNTDDPNELRPETRTQILNHTYDRPGSYTFTLNAVDITNSTASEGEVTLDIIVEDLPDLRAASVSSNITDFEFDAPFHVNYQIFNAGDAIADPIPVSIYLVSRTDLDAESLADSAVAVKIGEQTLDDGLERARSYSGEAEVTLDAATAQMMAAGEWYPAILVDPTTRDTPEGIFRESDETNNYVSGSNGIMLQSEAEKPDLVPSDLLGSPTTTTILQSVEVSFWVTNESAVPTDTSTYNVYLSDDNVFDPDTDLVLGEGTIRALEANDLAQVALLRFDLDAPVLDAAELYVIVALDEADAIQETVAGESNNVLIAAQPITVTGQPERIIDLNVGDLAVTPTVSYVGGQIDVSFFVENLGNDDPGQFYCQIFASPDETLEYSEDILVAQLSTAALNAGTRDDKDWVLSLNVGTYTPGDYHLFVVCDPSDQITETDETNNILGPSEPITVNADPRIDFRLQSIVVTPLSVDTEDPANDTVTVTAEVCNDGEDTAHSPLVELFISLDETITQDDHSLAAEVVPAVTIAPGACEAISINAKVTCLAFASDYSVGLVVDPDGIYNELDETNNTKLAEDAGGAVSINAAGVRCVCTDDVYDPEGGGAGNESAAAASDLNATLADNGMGQFNAAISGLAFCGGDATERDFYRVDLDLGDTLNATINFVHDDGDLNLRVFDLSDPAGTELLSEGDTDTESLSFLSRIDGVNAVIVEVLPSATGNSNYYELDLQVIKGPLEPDFEPTLIELTGGDHPTDLVNYDFDVTMTNHGVNPGSAPVRVYLSSSPTYDSANPPAYLVTMTPDPDVPIPRLDSVVLTFDPVDFLTIYPDIPTGDYYFIAVADPDNVLVEADESNNVLVSDAVFIDTSCIIDVFEGPNSNDTFADATTIRPSANALNEYNDLAVCNQGRQDYYRLCVPSGTPINHVGFMQHTPNSQLRISLYDLNESRIQETGSGNDLVAIDVPTHDCATTADCDGTETCVGGFCANGNGEHCLYAHAKNNHSVLEQFVYDLIIDTSTDELVGEPSNDDRNTPELPTTAIRTLTEDMWHASHGVDDDWYAIELPAGLTFTARYRAADDNSRVAMYVGDSTSLTRTIYPYEPSDYTTPSLSTYRFKVYSSNGSRDRTTGYYLELDGIGGVDLLARDVSTSPTSSARNGQALITWNLVNGRYDDTPVPVHYRYLLSEDQIADPSDAELFTLEAENVSPGILAGLGIMSLQQKVYFREDLGGSVVSFPEETFGDYYLLIDINPETGPGVHEIDEVEYANNVHPIPIHLSHVCEEDPNEASNNDTPSNATSLPGAGYVSSQLSVCAGDIDYFTFTAAAGTGYTVELNNMISTLNSDLDVFVYEDAGGGTLGPLIGFGTGVNTANETINITPSGSSRDLIIEVYGFQSSYTNIYELSIQ